MRNYFLILAAIFFYSCEETIVLDTQQIPPSLVIESHITTQDKLHTVKLSLSVDFYYDQKPPMIKDAVVSITDVTSGETYPFVHNNSNREDYQGIFVSEVAFEGKTGHTYELQVKYNGEVYTAQETLYPVTKIDELSYRINNAEYKDPEKEGYFYQVLLNAAEPQETKDYYLFKFYRNDSLVYARESDLYFTDDEMLGPEIANLPLPVFYSKGDKARVEIFSISRQAFIYLTDLVNVLNNDSGMFSPPPANPRTNISNNALGYFMASDISSETIIIQ